MSQKRVCVEVWLKVLGVMVVAVMLMLILGGGKSVREEKDDNCFVQKIKQKTFCFA